MSSQDLTGLLRFDKVEAAGNDFVIFADSEVTDPNIPPPAGQVQLMCDRRRGIGADGVIRAVQREGIWFMDYWNADGSLAEMCGNGVRAYVRYLVSNGLVTLEHGQTLPIDTRSGIKEVQPAAVGFSVDLGRWRPRPPQSLWTPGMSAAPAAGFDLGNPHLALEVTQEQLSLLDLSAAPNDGELTDCNAEFFAFEKVREGVGIISMRVYERGCGETLSCGTGTAAAALAARAACAPQVHFWQVKTRGGNLSVRMFPAEDGEHVALSGPARTVFTGWWPRSAAGNG